MDTTKEKRKRKPRAKKATKAKPDISIEEAEKRIAQLLKKIEELEKRPTKNVIRGVRIAKEKSNLAETGRIRKLEAEIEALQKKIKEQQPRQPRQAQPQPPPPPQLQPPVFIDPRFAPSFGRGELVTGEAEKQTVSYLSGLLKTQTEKNVENLDKFLLRKIPDEPDLRSLYRKDLINLLNKGDDATYVGVLASIPDKSRSGIFPHDTPENRRRIDDDLRSESAETESVISGVSSLTPSAMAQMQMFRSL